MTVGGILMYEALGELADVAYTTITGITSNKLGEVFSFPLTLILCKQSEFLKCTGCRYLQIRHFKTMIIWVCFRIKV